MKKLIAAMCAAACFALVLAGCSSGGAASSSSAADSSSATASANASESEGSTGLANPWSGASSAADAGKGAGVGTFTSPVGLDISLGTIKADWASYSYMDGVAEARCPAGAVEMTVRKGQASKAQDGDISGDYNQYAYTWERDIEGVHVICSGNRDGEATKTIWESNGYCYCILAYGAGGDDNYGLPADDLAIMVPAIS